MSSRAGGKQGSDSALLSGFRRSSVVADSLKLGPPPKARSTSAAPPVRVGRVVAIDLGRLGVGLTHPFLDGPKRRPGGRQLRAEGVAQLMEGDFSDPRALQRRSGG
jgi:hypothetical protein